MDPEGNAIDILHDDLSRFAGRGPAFVTLGETMVRDTPADQERLERTRQVWVSLAGSEFSVAVLLARLGVPTAYVTRLPNNPYGWMLRNVAREQGVNTDHFVWAGPSELMGRVLYEVGRTPRPGEVWYQRRGSAASLLGAGMVDWPQALAHARLLHVSGITFGLARHSGYARNPLLEAFQEALQARPSGCLVGLDFNYRSTLWSVEEARAVLTPIIEGAVDILITSLPDMARFYGIAAAERAAAIDDAALRDVLQRIVERFGLKAAAVTLRRGESAEEHTWESAALDAQGHFFRSPAARPIAIADRLGGGDAWTGGFYYGLLTAPSLAEGIARGVQVGDAATRLKQTLMFDLPIISRQEVQALLDAEATGGVLRTRR